MLERIMAIGGCIMLMGNVGAVIYKVIRPSLDVRKRVDELEKHDKQDYSRIQALEKVNQAQCKLLMAMIDHMIDGNHVEKMKETRDHIIELIADV